MYFVWPGINPETNHSPRLQGIDQIPVVSLMAYRGEELQTGLAGSSLGDKPSSRAALQLPISTSAQCYVLPLFSHTNAIKIWGKWVVTYSNIELWKMNGVMQVKHGQTTINHPCQNRLYLFTYLQTEKTGGWFMTLLCPHETNIFYKDWAK